MIEYYDYSQHMKIGRRLEKRSNSNFYSLLV
jgi:hypothetical protein